MARDPIPTYCFAVVVVRQGNRFLLVHEKSHEQKWYLPAGRVEPGETFEAAARRETLEESGVPVHLTGIIRVEHSPTPAFSRMRVVFLAEPSGDVEPKKLADKESLGAAWVTLEDLNKYELRGHEVHEVIQYVSSDRATIHPLSLIQPEVAPY